MPPFPGTEKETHSMPSMPKELVRLSPMKKFQLANWKGTENDRDI